MSKFNSFGQYSNDVALLNISIGVGGNTDLNDQILNDHDYCIQFDKLNITWTYMNLLFWYATHANGLRYGYSQVLKD